MPKIFILAMLLAGSVGTAGAQDPAKSATTETVPDTALIQPGFGTLKQDEFTVGLRAGALLVKVTPLDERIIRLAAPDTYTRLHALAESRRAAAMQRTGSQDPELFLVSFFSYEPNVTFQPEDVQLEYNGKQLRAAAIMPLSATWGRQIMGQQEIQNAIYVFADPMDFELPFVLKYGFDQSGDWQRILPRLEVEKSKAKSKQVEKK